MILAWMEFGAGLLVVLLTLSDIFSSIMIPGPNKGFLKIAVRVRIVSLPFGGTCRGHAGTVGGSASRTASRRSPRCGRTMPGGSPLHRAISVPNKRSSSRNEVMLYVRSNLIGSAPLLVYREDDLACAR